LLKLVFGGTPLTAGTIVDRMGSIPVGFLLYPVYNLLVILIGLAAAFAVWWFIYRTKFGVILRATSEDRRMAAALGVDVGRVYVQAFALGCFMAGLGGAVVVPAQAAVLGMGIESLILAFVVVVIGGLGSLEGALVGALIVSLVRTAGIQFFPEIELAVLYLIATAVLIVRPTGLFGRA
jgi:branched-chain amino acid transport system permease protein